MKRLHAIAALYTRNINFIMTEPHCVALDILWDHVAAKSDYDVLEEFRHSFGYL